MFFHLLVVCGAISSNIFSGLGQDIFCDDAFQCVGQSLSDVGVVQIRGYKSASGDTTSIAGAVIYALSSFGAYQIGSVELYAGIYGIGAFSGMEGTYNGSFDMFAYGVGSLANADVNGDAFDSALTCFGSMSCTEMTITGVRLLNCLGSSKDCQFMTVETLGTGQSLRVEAFGYYALYGSIIRCKSGDSCFFECYGTACFGAYIICEAGSNCDIETLYPGNDDYYPLTDLSEPLPNIPEFEENWDIDIVTQGLNNDANCNLDIATTFDVEYTIYCFCFCFCFLFLFVL